MEPLTTIRCETPAEACVAAVKMCLDGVLTYPRNIPCREVREVQILIYQPWKVPPILERKPRISNDLAFLEAAQLVGLTQTQELVRAASAKAFSFVDDLEGSFHGSYPSRISGTVEPLLKLLSRDPQTRQAVLTVYESKFDLNSVSKDVPCTVAVQFWTIAASSLKKRLRLGVTVRMRSSDAFLGLPYDLTQFAFLQAAIAAHLSMDPGPYIHSACSLHLYEADVASAATIKISDKQPIWNNLVADRQFRQTSSMFRSAIAGLPTAPSTAAEFALIKSCQKLRAKISAAS